jgi:hypothetical protein
MDVFGVASSSANKGVRAPDYPNRIKTEFLDTGQSTISLLRIVIVSVVHPSRHKPLSSFIKNPSISDKKGIWFRWPTFPFWPVNSCGVIYLGSATDKKKSQ